jgi:hypothetical protein
MNNELTIQSNLPVSHPKRSVPSRIFGNKPKTVAKRGTILIVALLVGYFGVVGNLMHDIDASPDFMPADATQGGSHAVSMAAALIERETVTHHWAVNDPVFYPTTFMDNMPNFQNGVLRAVSRFTMTLEDQIGRTRGSSAIDPDLGRAVGLLQYPPDVWMFDFSQSMLPVAQSDAQYRAALDALRLYNQRVASGAATFELRADTLATALQRMGAELGARTAQIDNHLRSETFMIDGISDDVFYYNKGLVYATYLLLRELGRDFEQVIVQQNLQGVWDQALDSLRVAAGQRPMVVLNASGDGSFFANHLYLQGFYIKRAMLQLDEITRVVAVR